MLAMMESRGGEASVTSSSSPVTVSSTSLSPPHSSSAGYSSSVRQIMLSQYSPWVMSTYGDSAKTKTITARKYSRILGQLKALSGSDKHNDSSPPLVCEDSKFKLWVKTKGFTVGPPNGHPDAANGETSELLYIPTGTDKTSDGKVHFVYKKVAMVEQFFDIIYSVHVESAMDTQLRGRSGKHCGQKRTYRAVADQYAFIPREAISKFLLYCVDCQRKNFGESRRLPSLPKKAKTQQQVESRPVLDEIGESASPELCHSAAAAAALSQAVVATMQSLARAPLIQATHPSILATRAAAALIRNGSGNIPSSSNGCPKMTSDDDGGDIDLSLPITSTYLRRMRALGFAAGLELQKENNNMESSEITEDLEEEEEEQKVEEVEEEEEIVLNRHRQFTGLFGVRRGDPTHEEEEDSNEEDTKEDYSSECKMSQLSTLLSQNGSAINLLISKQVQSQQQQQASGAQQTAEGQPSMMDTVTQDDASSNGAKDDEDEDDDDDLGDERIEGIICGDPEKLKAFNMFVRLFVDENLDRHVPISKQPKEKIQAIIDSCTRQFPEHACRARKRIRTYLKSCRRTKRTREQAGLDPTNTRPTPPHLTSVQAEQLLARACENEAENAKRMRMGMEPISQPMPIYTTSSESPIDVVSTVNVMTNTTSSKAEHQQQLAATLLAASQSGPEGKGPAPVVGPLFPAMNGNALAAVSTSAANTATLYRQPFPAGTAVFPTVVNNPPPLLNLQAPPQPAPTTTTSSGHHQNGPLNNEAIKKSPLLNHKLNTTEMAAVRQLITGYRESAAFLLRSADELEQLLQIQPKL